MAKDLGCEKPLKGFGAAGNPPCRFQSTLLSLSSSTRSGLDENSLVGVCVCVKVKGHDIL